ncbi:MAG: 6-phosphogluconolactonase [Planctomycetes bacterium]|nr:6-phosphogluconolactonase [Planctomycetota bacterium]
MLPYQPVTVAEALYTILDQAAAARGRATLAIPGGRSPAPVLTALAGLCTDFVRERLHLLWLDERAVPLGHGDRNDAPTLAAWQAGGALPAFVHPMPAERADLEAAATDYAEQLREATGGSGALDVCLIGIGEDGHLASLFPNHAGLTELAEVFAIHDSPKPPAKRLTLSLPVLHRAAHHLVLALGGAKGQVARRAMRGPDPALPVSLLPGERTVWYLDDAAAAVFA